MPVDKPQHARILIIEDDPTMAHDIQDLLVDAGFNIAGMAGKLEKALALIESGACDAAIVDANLAGVSASPAASALTARGLPFIVLSGYSREQLQGAYPGALLIQKPCRPAQLFQALDTILLK
jgi:DNA-binding response OmpR family regulator